MRCSTRRVLMSLFSLLVMLPAAPAAAQTFEDVSGLLGLDLTHSLSPICDPPIGSGSAWADYDGDGDLDFFVTNHGGPNRLYRNEGDLDLDGLPNYVDVAPELALSDPAGVGLGAVFIDYDNDGDQDLYVTSWGGNSLYQNQLADTGVAGFLDATFFAGVGDYGRGITASWADFDGDGFLDFYIAKHMTCNVGFPDNRDALFRNLGNGTFTNVSDWLCEPGICPQLQEALGFSPGWFDFDDDGDPDLYLANDDIGHDGTFYTNVFWRNDGPDGAGGWTFTDISDLTGTGVSANAMGLAIGDFDNDLDLDIAFSNIGPNHLFRNDGGVFTDIAESAGVQRTFVPESGDLAITWATALFDHDNDMLLDLLFVGGYITDEDEPQPNVLFGNDGDGTFTDLSTSSGFDDAGRGRSASITDFDGDGFLDVLVGNYGEPSQLMRNLAGDAPDPNHWLAFTVEGSASNRDAIGTRFFVTTGDGVTQMRELSTGPTHGGGDFRALHFGLGANTEAEVSVTWPTGEVQPLGTVVADQYLFVREGFSVNGIGPGVAGVENILQVSGAAPGATVAVFTASEKGQDVFDGCDNAVLELEDPIRRQTVTADGNGNLVMRFTPPGDLAGETFFVQAVQNVGCTVTNLFEVTFE